MIPLGALILSDIKMWIDLGVLWRPCWLSRVPGNVLCLDVKSDERNKSLLDRCSVWYCEIWYLLA